jgi:hypothetical protein
VKSTVTDSLSALSVELFSLPVQEENKNSDNTMGISNFFIEKILLLFFASRFL